MDSSATLLVITSMLSLFSYLDTFWCQSISHEELKARLVKHKGAHTVILVSVKPARKMTCPAPRDPIRLTLI